MRWCALLQSTSRAFLDFQDTQDDTNSTAPAGESVAVPAFDSAAQNASPNPFMAAPAIPAFKLDDEAESDATVQKNDVQAFEEMAVARMLIGAALVSSADNPDMYRPTDWLSAQLISKRNFRYSSPRKRTATVRSTPS